MCLAVPGKVKEIIAQKEAVVDFMGVNKKISLGILEDVKAGEYVIVHAGFAISKVNEEEALETISYFKQL